MITEEAVIIRPELDEHGMLRGIHSPQGDAAIEVCAGALSLVLFWGVHPSRTAAGKAEKRTLSGMMEFFTQRGLQARLRVILADIHGAFNGIDNRTYLASVKRCVVELGGECLWLSQIYTAGNLDSDPGPISMAELESEKLQASLVRGARNRGGGEDLARRYAALRRQEVEVINELLGDNGILLVVGGPEYAPLFRGVPRILFCRAKAKSGAKWVPFAPWIQ